MNIDDLQALALQKIGRNLLVFQEIERLMKYLVVNSSIETTAIGVSPSVSKRETATHKKTFGQIRKQFFSELFEADSDPELELEPLNVAVRSTFRLSKSDQVQFKKTQSLFLGITDERNDLVHHFLERWSLASIDSSQSAITHLDQQHERALGLRKYLAGLFDTLQEGRRVLLAFINSPEGQRQFELQLLQRSKCIGLLNEYAQTLARKDGWAPLASAGSLLSRVAQDELASTKQRFRHRTLKALIIASELFDVIDEPTPGGGSRTMFKVVRMHAE